MGNAPDALLRLVDRFDQDRKVFLSGDYKEEQLRAESFNPPSSRSSALAYSLCQPGHWPPASPKR